MDSSQNIQEIKKRLGNLKVLKENFFLQKEAQYKDISNKISHIKELNSIYNSKLSTLKEMIRQRDSYNKKVGELISEIKNIKDQKKEHLNKNKINFDPYKIKLQIEGLESKIETQALDFEKEKELMKKINSLKKIYLQSSELNKIIEKEHQLQKQIEETKIQADKAHKQVLSLQKEVRKIKKEFISNSKSVMGLKKEQNATFEKFLQTKKEYNTLKDKVEKQRSRQIKHTLDIKRDLMQKKQRELEEKIKNKQKITTEDLLVFQSR